jgi:hydrogenase nickel incorporation protein HypA/HybF
MHELDIANRIVDRALDAAQDEGAHAVTGLEIQVGTLTHLDPDQLRFCVEAIAEGTLADGATVTVERLEARLECDCGWSGEPDAVEGFAAVVPDRFCPDCGARAEPVRGRECRLVGVTATEVKEPGPEAQTDTR